MPRRETKRGDERTPLTGSYDVIVCGASFAGLTVARQLAGSGARVLVLDRYEIGERQTSACGIPTEWLRAMGLEASARQEFGELVVHTPHGTSRYDLPWTFSTFDYRELCELLWAQSRRRVRDRQGQRPYRRDRPHRPRRRLRPADRRRARLAPDPRLRRRLPAARRPALARARGPSGGPFATTSRSGSTAATCPPATAGASPLAASSGSASAPSTRASTSRTRPCCWPRTSSGPPSATRATGSRTRSAPGPRTGSSSSATRPGHCLPLTAEGIRTAFYFGIKLGRRAPRGRRGPPGPRGGAPQLRRVRRRARMEVPLDAPCPEAPAEDAGPRPAGGDPRLRAQALHRLGLRPLPQHRPARVRGPADQRSAATSGRPTHKSRLLRTPLPK